MAVPRKDGSGFVGEALSANCQTALFNRLYLDITERKRAQEALRENGDADLRSMPRTPDFGSQCRNGEFTASIARSPCTAHLQVRRFREKAVEAVHAEDRSRVEENFRRAVARRELLRHEFRFLLPDGAIRWVNRQASRGPFLEDR